MHRRTFLGGLGAAAAGTSLGLQGCDAIRKPVEKILPYVKRPEDLIPGQPLYFATSWHQGGTVEGLLVESQEGRPTKIDGNPQHPHNLGTASGWAQASVHDLYDPDRSRSPRWKGAAISSAQADTYLSGVAERLVESKGSGLALLVESNPSPTFQGMLASLRAKLPQARVYRHDLLGRSSSRAGAELTGAAGLVPVYSLAGAETIVAIDGDFFHSEGESTRLAREYADGRRVAKPGDKMNRLYAVETGLSITGTQADHRLRLKGTEISGFVALLADRLKGKGVKVPAAVPTPTTPVGNAALVNRFVDALAGDLVKTKGKSLVMVGERQPAAVHGLVAAINVGLGNLGKTLAYHTDPDAQVHGDLAALTGALLGGKVSHLIIVGGNPAYTSPADLAFGDALTQATALSVHLSSSVNETSLRSTMHLPAAHYLESWGDLATSDGVVSLQQPLIAPLHGAAWTASELLARLTGTDETAYALVRAHWQRASNTSGANLRATLDAATKGREAAEAALTALTDAAPAEGADAVATREAEISSRRAALSKARAKEAKAQSALDADTSQASARFERNWRQWLHDGVVQGSKSVATRPTFDWSGVAKAWKAPAAGEGMELTFAVDPSVGDGRFANNPWLQEIPDSVSKLTWDNAAMLSTATAAKLGVTSGDMLTITLGQRTLKIVALETMGVADNALVLPLGYGRTEGGRVADGAGFDVNAIRTSTHPSIAAGATVTAVTSMGAGSTPVTYPLALTQTHHRLEPKSGWARRPLARVATAKEWAAKPEFVKDSEVMKADKLKSLFAQPNETEGHQWGMTIDLNTCNGCNACTIA
ncbi:MAG: hypothetical protein QF464_08640, partial [Myxococcota bacterium]|nr:hypothetical protein [Myxococcota bacterium]